jgi:hypothetical protein
VVKFEKQIELLFEPFKNRAGTFPSPRALATKLSAVVSKARSDVIAVPPNTTPLFATAAVEMWLRSLHSFLTSTALTRASVLWASVAGYYASHYSVRAFAHLLGYFHLHHNRRLVKFEVVGRQRVFNIIKKNAGDGEHKVYWRIVKQDSSFASDPFFTFNPERDDVSDCAHRNFANYVDHINRFREFHEFDAVFITDRIKHLSSLELSSVPIPNRAKYPDVDSVHIIAYHRIVKFRTLVDSILGGKNRFWTANRSPNWCSAFLDFQIVEPRFVSAYSN